MTGLFLAAVALAATESDVRWDVGADLRVRHEIVNHIPRGGLAGKGDDGPYMNWIRTRTRAWIGAEAGDFGFFSRVGNEFRWYPTGDAPGGNPRNWSFPDELYLDNLYFDAHDLFGGFLDLRIGRQDFLGPEAYGSQRVIGDGNGSDDARTVFFDAVRARMIFSETEKLDFLAVWCNSRDSLNWGSNHSRADGHHGKDRDRNTIIQGSHGLVESGGGLYHRSRTAKELPADIYWIFKRESHAVSRTGAKLTGRSFHTFGALLRPVFSENLSGEFEGAWQIGEKDTGAVVGGTMGYGALKWAFLPEKTVNPWVKAGCYYMSGDRDRDGDGDSDRAWNCVWGRWPQFSDLYAKTFAYGIGYWSNLIYPSFETGVDWKDRLSFRVGSGPLMAAVDDGCGYGKGGRDIGWLSCAHLGLPLCRGIYAGRGRIDAHLRAELLNPTGDYYITDRPAYYFRWDVTVSF